MTYLESLWSQEKSPILNAVMFPNGRIDLIEAPDLLLGKGEHLLAVESTVSWHQVTDIRETLLTTLSTSSSGESSVIASCGEAGWGGDGFVAVSSFVRELQWLAFFDFSNPFLTVEVLDDCVVATNNHGHLWHFRLDQPSRIRIVVP